ncbi:MAG: diaminopimelate decarboxylase [Clostridia bacterium]|nr:diaminopimelate decarboxylase [Clostridia bacterium]MBQ5601428.1 diaminopimelate decarboxylase [Clostridia bacterium]
MLHSSYGVNSSGNFTLGGADTVALAKKYGTPLYLINENDIIEKCREYRDAVKKYFSEKSAVYYASKALSIKEIYRIIEKEDINTDVVSLGELYTAIKAGYTPSRICLHGNNKTDEEIRAALNYGVGSFVVECFDELDSISRIAAELGKKARVLLRITPNIDCHSLRAISTGKLDSKFGVPIETGQADEFVGHALSLSSLEVIGYHCHCGSQVFEIQPYIDQLEVMLRFTADMKEKFGYSPEYLNIGGGFGTRYTESDEGIDITEGIRILGEKLTIFCKMLGLDRPHILMEPGRSIVASAGVTLYTVGSVKNIGDFRTYVTVDGGMTDNPRYALYASKYEALIANKADKPKNLVCSIAGRCCESGDLIGENMNLQKTQRGDILAVTVTGAYNYSMASNYNRVPRPALVIIKDGEDRLAVKRETIDDIIQNDI